MKVSDLSLTSAEGDFSRGGYVKGEGVDGRGNVIKFFRDWGWCSSGGSGCGFNICFSAPTPEQNFHYYVEVRTPEPNYVYELMKNTVCERYSLQAECASKKFEKTSSGRTIFSLDYTNDGKFVEGSVAC